MGAAWGLAAAWAIFLAVQVAAVTAGVLPAPPDSLFDPDAYTRLLQVRQLAGTGRWWDGTLAALNTPDGLPMHWTRPLDALILALALPLRAVIDGHQALAWAGIAISPLLGLATIAVLRWGTAGLVGQGTFLIATGFLAMQRGTLQAFAIGRPDHHGLLVLLLAAAFALLVRRRFALQGLAVALAIWVCVEGLLIALFCLLFLSLAAVREGRPALRDLARFGLALAAGCTAALIVERPPADWLSHDLDRLSAVHVTLAWLIAAAALLLERLRPERPAARLAAGAALAAGVAVAMAVIHPAFFDSPFSAAGPLARRMVNGRITEMRPLWPATPAALFGLLIEFAVMPAAVAMAAWQARHGRDGERALALAGLGGLAVFVPAALHMVREAPMAELLFALPAAQAVAALRGSGGRNVAAAGLLLSAASLGTAATIHATRWQGVYLAAPPAPCGYGAVAPHVDGPILTFPLEDGPAAAWATGRPSVGGPYHRNEAGIRDTLLVFGSQPPDGTAVEVLRRRGIGIVSVCRGAVPARLDPRRLVSRLAAGDAPDWLVRVPLPAPLEERIRLYRVAP
jgi:hypothetical protein